VPKLRSAEKTDQRDFAVIAPAIYETDFIETTPRIFFTVYVDNSLPGVFAFADRLSEHAQQTNRSKHIVAAGGFKIRF
jgi:predicted transcriptional regulator